MVVSLATGMKHSVGSPWELSNNDSNAPEIVLPSDIIFSVQIEHSAFRWHISFEMNKLVLQVDRDA